MRRAALALIVALLAANSPAAAQHAEDLTVPSLTLTNEQVLAGNAADGTPVVLTGRLRLPRTTPPFPVVVLMHGSGGPDSGPVARWEWVLRPLGIATFSLDSFTARGVLDHASDPPARVADPHLRRLSRGHLARTERARSGLSVGDAVSTLHRH